MFLLDLSASSRWRRWQRPTPLHLTSLATCPKRTTHNHTTLHPSQTVPFFSRALFLHRRDPVAVAISLHYARVTNVYVASSAFLFYKKTDPALVHHVPPNYK